MFTKYKIAFLITLYSIHTIQSSVEDKKNTPISKQIIEKLHEIYAINNTKIEKLDGTKKNLNSLNIETDALMHDKGTLTTLENIYFELLNKKEFHITNILNYPTIQKNNLISELSVIADLKLLETKKNSIHGITTLINEADNALSGQLDKAKSDLTNVLSQTNKDITNLIDKANSTLTEKLNKTKTEFETLIKKSEQTIKTIIWHSQHALTYIMLTTFCAKILFNEYLFFKNKENNEPLSKKDLFFSLLTILLASKGLLFSLEKLNNNKENY
jgi:hypothetical protein